MCTVWDIYIYIYIHIYIYIYIYISAHNSLEEKTEELFSCMCKEEENLKYDSVFDGNIAIGVYCKP